MLGPPGISATALAREVGVSQTQLSRWRGRARTLAGTMSDTPQDKPAPAVPASPKKWTAEEKLRVLVAAHGLTGEALGALLRREGLHEAQLEGWRSAAAGALSQSAEGGPGGALTAGQRRRLASSEKRVKELERELRRKDKALAETAALLVLEKKLQALGWDERHPEEDDEDDASAERRER